MATLPSDLVYQGFWIDHSEGPTLGSTITLSSSKANVVLVVLTLIIAFAGAHLWDLIALVVFLLHATDKPKDGVHHQIQSLLRNASSPATYAFSCFKILFNWRSQQKQNPQIPRLIYTGTIALLCSVGFVAAGILSSAVITSSSINVLASPSHCGHWPNLTLAAVNDNGDTTVKEAKRWEQTFLTQSLDYARKCPSSNSKDTACNVFVQPAVNFTVNYGECPFGDKCLLDDKPALVMDTGLLDSNDVFGLNAPKDDRILFRKTSTCGVIDSDPYLGEVANASQYLPILPGDSLYAWSFGPTTASPYTFGLRGYYANLTSQLTTRGMFFYATGDPANDNLQNIWDPIAPFKKSDADTIFNFVVLNGVIFFNPVDDPLFAAHRVYNYTASRGATVGYLSDSLGRVLGCTEQYQFCTPSGACTPLKGQVGAALELKKLDMTAKQAATARIFIYQIAADYNTLDLHQVAENNPPAYEAAQYIASGKSVAIPPNQWEIEAKGTFSFIMAAIQKGVAEVATGPLGTGHDSEFYPYLERATDPAELELCGAQKMKAADGYSNINVFGLAFTVGLCCLIVLVNLTTTPTLKIIARRKPKMSTGMRHWVAEYVLQIQRKALEGIDRGTWQNLDREVPTTETHEVFPGIAVEMSNTSRTSTSTSTTSFRKRGLVGSSSTFTVVPISALGDAARNMSMPSAGTGSTIQQQIDSPNFARADTMAGSARSAATTRVARSETSGEGSDDTV